MMTPPPPLKAKKEKTIIRRNCSPQREGITLTMMRRRSKDTRRKKRVCALEDIRTFEIYSYARTSGEKSSTNECKPTCKRKSRMAVFTFCRHSRALFPRANRFIT